MILVREQAIARTSDSESKREPAQARARASGSDSKREREQARARASESTLKYSRRPFVQSLSQGSFPDRNSRSNRWSSRRSSSSGRSNSNSSNRSNSSSSARSVDILAPTRSWPRAFLNPLSCRRPGCLLGGLVCPQPIQHGPETGQSAACYQQLQ